MTKIVVLGGTGYAGSAIVAEGVARGLEVVSLSRSLPKRPVEGAEYVEGSANEPGVLGSVLKGADVIVGALSPRADMQGNLLAVYRLVAEKAREEGARFIVIGGFGSLRPQQGARRFVEEDAFPAEYRGESFELLSVLEYLASESEETLDWIYVSPAADFGAYAPGTKTGRYVMSGDVAVFAADGTSKLSGQDLALAIIDEAVQAKRYREHVSIAY